MKKREKKLECKAVAKAPQHRAILRVARGPEGRNEPVKVRYDGGLGYRALSVLLAILLLTWGLSAATIKGTLLEIYGTPLSQTKVTFWPTNLVIVRGTGLSAGPPKTITTDTNGAFSLSLDAGPYTVCLPLVPTRKCFTIVVPEAGTNTLYITNLIVSGQIFWESNGIAGGAIQYDP